MAATFSNLIYHIIFSTKERVPIITRELMPPLHDYLGGILRGLGGEVLAIGGMSDHIHIICVMKPALSPADIVRKVKANSSKWINEEHHPDGKFSWQTGYMVFSVSESIAEQVVEYVRHQEQHHRKLTFQEEYRAFLAKNGINIDEEHVWG